MRLAAKLVVALAFGTALWSLGCGRIVEGESASNHSWLRPAQLKVPGGAQIEAGSSWPCLFGPDHIGVSTERDLALPWSDNSPDTIWTIPIGTGYSAPVVAEGVVVALHRIGDEEVVCSLNAETGSPLWEHRYATTYVCPYDYSSGPYSTPTIHNGRVYAIGAQLQLHCLNLADGQLIWSRKLADEYAVPEPLFAFGASPLIEGEALIFNLGAVDDRAGVVALDTETGQTMWTATDHGPGYATPIAATIHGRRYVFAFTREGLVCLDPHNGTVNWEVPFKPRKSLSVNATSPVVIDDLVLVSTGPGHGSLCLRVTEAGYDEVWRDRRVLDSQFNNLVVVNDHLYGFTSSRQGGPSFRCIDPESGALKWELHSAIERGSALAVDGFFVLLGESGHLACAPITSNAPPKLSISMLPILAAPTYSAPALADGRLYVRNEESLICLDLRSKR